MDKNALKNWVLDNIKTLDKKGDNLEEQDCVLIDQLIQQCKEGASH